jgi:hypothetical protein
MGILPMRSCGIGIVPMIHRLEADATKTPHGVATGMSGSSGG